MCVCVWESPDHKTYFVKIHATYPALLRGADELLLRMPIRVRDYYRLLATLPEFTSETTRVY